MESFSVIEISNFWNFQWFLLGINGDLILKHHYIKCFISVIFLIYKSNPFIKTIFFSYWNMLFLKILNYFYFVKYWELEHIKHYTGAEQESSILKSYQHVVNVPITSPTAPCLEVVPKSIWIGKILIYHQYNDFIL